MKFKRKFGRKRSANPKKGLFLVLLLAIVLYVMFNAESLMSALF